MIEEEVHRRLSDRQADQDPRELAPGSDVAARAAALV
jgi:hypothetical protein